MIYKARLTHMSILPGLTSRLCNALLFAPLLIAAFWLLSLCPAFAQSAGDANATIENIGNNITSIPQVAAVLSYVIGTFFTANGLLKMRAWMADSERNAINPAIFRIVVGALLILLPHIFLIVNNTLFTDTGQKVQIQPGNMNVFSKK